MQFIIGFGLQEYQARVIAKSLSFCHDNGIEQEFAVFIERKIMCKWGDTVPICVKIPEDLACSGKSYWKAMKIDSCIAPIVKALQEGGIDMRGSCCGHGGDGRINLQDGRVLVIRNIDGENDGN